MIVSSFSYIRNGFTYGYPFIESIKSILPIVNEFIVVVGDSTDGTKEAIEALNDDKIKIIDSIWDPNLRTGGKIFALQANIGIDNTSKNSDWLFHLQPDEIVHEKDLFLIKDVMEKELHNNKIEGFLFNFINFYGDYQHYCPSRRFHQKEIRIIRNDKSIRSYRDSMGFRRFGDSHSQWEKGKKLNVKQINATIYHYSWSRSPKKLKAKHIEFHNKYSSDDSFKDVYEKIHGEEYQFNEYDYLKEFNGSHPAVMHNIIQAQDWEFVYDEKKNNMTIKEKILRLLEKVTGKQWFIYKNYKVVK